MYHGCTTGWYITDSTPWLPDVIWWVDQDPETRGGPLTESGLLPPDRFNSIVRNFTDREVGDITTSYITGMLSFTQNNVTNELEFSSQSLNPSRSVILTLRWVQ